MQDTSDNIALVKWCEQLLTDGNYIEAKQFAKILHEDDTVSSLIVLAKTVEKNDGSSAALDLIENYLSTHNDMTNNEMCSVLSAEGAIRVNLQDYYPALNVFRRAQEFAKFSSTEVQNNIDLNIASLLVKLSDFESAQIVLNRSFEIKSENGATTNSSIVDLRRYSSEANTKVKFELDTALNQSANSEYDCVYFVSADLLSCQLFVNNLALQLSNLTTKNICLHIHGVVTGDDDPGFHDSAWSKALSDLSKIDMPICFTTLNLELSDLSDIQKETIYGVESYRLLPEIMSRYNCPIIVADIDLLPLFNPLSLIAEDFDVSLIIDPSSILDITQLTQTDLLVLNKSEEAMRFSCELSSYFQRALTQSNKLRPRLRNAGLAVSFYHEQLARIKQLSPTLIDKSLESTQLQKTYSSGSLFLGRNPELSPRDFASALEQSDYDFSPIMLARYMGTNNHIDAGLTTISNYMSKNKSLSRIKKFESLHLRGKIEAYGGHLNEAHESMVEAQKNLPKARDFDHARHSSLYQLAAVKAALGQHESAQNIFDLKLNVDCGNGWTTNTGIIDFTPYEGDHKAIHFRPLIDKFDVDKAKSVYLVAADFEYCRQFIPSLISQFETFNSDQVHLHIHGIAVLSQGKLEADWHLIKEMLDRSKLNTTFTVGDLTDHGLSTRKLKSAFASERFRLLPNLLKKYNLPVMIADIDQLPLVSPDKILDHNCNVQLLYSPKSVLNFLSVVSATISVYYPTQKGFEIAEMLKGYIDRAYSQPEKLDWHVDQAALAVAHYLFEDSKIGYLSTNIVEMDAINFTPAESLRKGAMFWSVTNSIAGNSKALVKLQREQNRLLA